MRDLLTYIGIALIAVLSAALVAPFVIDFDDWRSEIADQLSSASGARVTLGGPISLRLLPTPRFSAQSFGLQSDFGAVRATNAFFELSLPSLIQGRMQFAAVRLDGADISIAIDKARLSGGAEAQFDRLALHDAKLTLSRSGAPPLRLEGLDLVAQAPSLSGPFQGHGAAVAGGEKVKFTFASDALVKGLLPLKASLTAPGEMGKADFDGRLNFSGAPAFAGEAKASGQADAGPWQAQATLAARFDGVEAENVSARLGEGPLADKISGKASYAAASGKIALDLDSPHLGEAWAAAFEAPLLAAIDRASPLDARLNAETLDWRGVEWSHVRFDLTPDAPIHVQAQGPGGAQVNVSAAPERQNWRGKAAFKAADFSVFIAALRDESSLAGLKVTTVGLYGDFIWSRKDVVLTGAALRLDRARLLGDLRFTPQKPGGRAKLVAHLAAAALDLDATPEFGVMGVGGLDLDLSLEAQTVKLARNGQALGDAGRIKAHFIRAGDAAVLEKLELRNIGGADLTASGGWTGDFAGLKGEARLKATDFSELAKFLARLAPGAATRALALRGKALSPADLTFRAQGADKSFELSGALGGTKISASLAPRADGKLVGAFDLAAAEGGVLLNQLGAPVLLAQKLGSAHVTGQLQPDNDKLNLTAAADVAELHGAFHGQAGDPLTAPSLDGDLTLSGDAGKIWASVTGAPPAPLPTRLSAHLMTEPGAIKAQNLTGAWGDAGFSGALAFNADGIGGTLNCDHVSAPALVALVLGPPAPVKTGALWSSLSFAPVFADPPRARLLLETADLQPFGGKARFDLALGPGRLGISDGRLDMQNGILGGAFELRREGGQVTLDGDGTVNGFALKNPAFSAIVGGKFHFVGNGANAAALVASLAGGGGAEARDLTIIGAAATAPDEALAANESSEAPFDAALVVKQLDDYFARDAWRKAQSDFSLSLASGRLSFAEKSKALEGSFDLRDAGLTLALSVAAQKAPTGGPQPPPRGKVVWSGAWSAPVRHVDATGFVNAVALRALDREQARIEVMRAQDRARLRALSAPQ
jgi:uncharacterized protein involved in outer membrane biogenesis